MLHYYLLENGLDGFASLEEISEMNIQHRIISMRPATAREIQDHDVFLALNPILSAA